MMFSLPTQCLDCIHYHRPDYEEQETCDAFPSGIPQPILDGASHWDPYPGDHGITFWPTDDDGGGIAQYIGFWYVHQGGSEVDLRTPQGE